MAWQRDDLLEFYQRELQYLRNAGTDFARTYPKIAGRLELGPDGSADPHVERLIEAFAYLTGRVQRSIEADFPRLTEALLDTLYPTLSSPVPAMAIARFSVDAPAPTGITVPRGTPVSAIAEGDLRCRFRTCYDVELWPLSMAAPAVLATDRWSFLDNDPAVAVLRLELSGGPDTFAALAGRRLRLHLGGDAIGASRLLELILTGSDRVAYVRGGRATIRPQGECVRLVGLAEDEAVLPAPGQGHPAYRLLQEYFVFPEKFRFVDLAIPETAGEGPLEILFLLPFLPPRGLTLAPDSLQLGCTPIINLFAKVAEPIRLDRRRGEYRVMPDARLDRVSEVHSIVEVVGHTLTGDRRTVYRPYFSVDHGGDADTPQSFWAARRVPTDRREAPGTDVNLSFVDLDMAPADPPDRTIIVRCLCTNRLLPEQVPVGAKLQVEQPASGARAECITRPTPPRPPPMAGQTPWRLVSHLSLNYLSVAEGEASLDALREMLRLYAPPLDAAAEQQVQGIRGLACRRVTRRVGAGVRAAMCRGLALTLDFDERRYVGASAFVLASVLETFFGLYASVNAFTQLSITSQQRSGVWYAWPARIGSRTLV